MTLYNPSLHRSAQERALDPRQAQSYRAQFQRISEAAQGLVAFVAAQHLSVSTFQGFRKRDERALLTLRTVGKSLDLDLPGMTRALFEQLDQTATMSLIEFQNAEAAHLFATIDSVEPDEVSVGDGRAAAERFHYAVETRVALLRYVLATLNRRYPAGHFGNLAEAAAWTSAFSAVIQEAEQVIEGTKSLLYDEATAAQSYLDTLRNRFELLEEQARGAAVTLGGDWRGVLGHAEARILDQLAWRHEQLERLAFGELTEVRKSGWLEAVAWQTARHAPVLGTLLLALAGGTAMVAHRTGTQPAVSLSLPLSSDGNGEGARNFPVLARHTAVAESFGQRARDEVAQFFATQQRGRQTLHIADSGTLRRVLEELGQHGYPAADVLGLLGLGSVDALVEPVTLDVRWSQGGRPLLLPPHQPVTLDEQTAPASIVTAPAPAVSPARFEGTVQPLNTLLVHRVQAGETLSLLAEQYDTTITQLMQDNRLDGDLLGVGQTLLVRGSATAQGTEWPRYDAANVRSSGSFPTSRVPAAIALGFSAADGNTLVAKYGETVWPSMEAMPEDARLYFTTTVQEVADFFNVRPGDIIGILQAENNNVGLRIHQPGVSSAGARGVGQVIARTWNGWANPQEEEHSRDLRAIDEYGGLGFDWAMREEWRAWKQGESDGSALANANADPDDFANSVSAVARHLVHWGLTRDRAATEPEWFQTRLADAISVYNSGRVLADAEEFQQSAANTKTTGQYVREAMAVSAATPTNLVLVASAVTPDPLREAYQQAMDAQFGVALSEQELGAAVDGSAVAAEVAAGKLTREEGARQLVEQTAQHYLAEGRAALAAGQPLPWPYVHSDETLRAQRLAARYLGHALTTWELENLVAETRGDEAAMTRALAERGDARIFAGARRQFDAMLRRTERGLPVATHEVAALVQPAMAGYNPKQMSAGDLQAVMATIEQGIRRLPEYREVHGTTSFTAMPLQPMPRLIRGFGAPVDYQAGGTHTGIDVANPRVNGEEPPIYAVEAGTVVHVGPLYCDTANACRGGNSIVLHHGDDVYTVYSHNSAASVQVGQQVRAGEMIGRQGNEGYSFGSHLHLEVHTGAPFSGDWQQPFKGGQFEDPMQWLPQS